MLFNIYPWNQRKIKKHFYSAFFKCLKLRHNYNFIVICKCRLSNFFILHNIVILRKYGGIYYVEFTWEAGKR